MARTGECLVNCIDDDIFMLERVVYILKEDISAIAQLKKVGQNIIVAYIRCILTSAYL